MFSRIKSLLSKSVPLSDFNDEGVAKSYLELTQNDVLHGAFERPELIKIIGASLQKKKILIAGSGPGIYAEMLNSDENDITCVDKSQAMHDLAFNRLGDGVKYIAHDLNQPIPLSGDTFELIVSPLTIQYISNLNQLFSEFSRILKPGGRVVFSTIHPFVNQGENYFAKELFEQQFSEFNIKIKSYRRPLNHFTEAILQNEFRIKGIYEPLPDQSLKSLNENIYNSLSKTALFIFFDIEKMS